MPPFLSPARLPLISKSEYYSSLPWFRRCLAMLNWRPVVDYELREIEFDRREIAYRQRMQQLQNESEQLRIEDEQRQIAHDQRMKQLKNENARLAELNAKIDAILFSPATRSSPPPSPPSKSET